MDISVSPNRFQQRLKAVAVANFLTFLIAVSSPVSAQPGNDSWCPEVADALADYRAGDYGSAQRLALAAQRAAANEAARCDASLILAMIQARSAARSEWSEAITRIGALVDEYPAIGRRPDLLLAMGVARLGLNETSAALDFLDQAQQRFAAERDPAGQLTALAETATAWARHSEWDTTPRRFISVMPRSAEAAQEIRLEQIGKLRALAAALPNATAALHQIDLARAELLLNDEAGAAAGERLLEEIVQSATMTPAGAQAALLLAKRRETAGRWADALAIYDRVAAAGLSPASAIAEARVSELRRPQIEIEAPESVQAGEAFEIGLRVLSVPKVILEIRRVDLDSWLDDRKSRGNPALLPESGAVQVTRELDTIVADGTPHGLGEWRSTTLSESLKFELPPGAYVLIARGVTNGRGPLEKRLIISSDLEARVFLTPQNAVVWAVSRAGTTSQSPPALKGKFWMLGSFAPTSVRFDGTIGTLRIPNEARVMSERSWICLVQTGDQLALCRGSLPAGVTGNERPTVATIAGPIALQVGGKWSISGIILSDRVSPTAAQDVEIDIRDVMDIALERVTAPVSADGMFAMQIPVPREWAGKQLRATVRQGDFVLENIQSRLVARVDGMADSDLQLATRVPAAIPGDSDRIPLEYQASYPWGTPLSIGQITTAFRPMRIPAAGGNLPPNYGRPVLFQARLNAAGDYRGFSEIWDFNLATGPIAVGATVDALGWDGRSTRASFSTLLAPARFYGWIRTEPAIPTAGAPMQFGVFWVDAEARIVNRAAHLEIALGDKAVADLPLFAAEDGARTRPWTPLAGGEYRVRAILPTIQGDSVTFESTIPIAADAHSAAPTPTLVATAEVVEAAGADPEVRFTSSDAKAEPMLAVMTVDGEIRAAEFRSANGALEALFPRTAVELAQASPAVWVAGPDGIQPVPLRLKSKPRTGLLSVEVLAGERVLPGATIRCAVRQMPETRGGGPASVLVRLADALNPGMVTFLPNMRRGARSEITAAPPDAFTGDVAEALFGGATRWSDVTEAAGDGAEFNVTLPESPGVFLLAASVRDRGGVLRSASTLIDTRGGLAGTISLPRRLFVGDRVQAALLIENSTNQPRAASLSVDWGDGLVADQYRLRGRGPEEQENPRFEPGSLVTIPPHGRIWLIAQVEASAVGSFGAIATFGAPGDPQKATCAYLVDAPLTSVAPNDTPLTPKPIQVRRSFELRTRRPMPEVVLNQDSETVGLAGDESETGSDATAADGHGHKRAADLSADHALDGTGFDPASPLETGQYLIVREEVTLPEDLAGAVWRQRVPVTTYTVSGMGPQFKPIGQKQRGTLDEYEYRIPQLTAGKHVHEYLLAGVRPGVGMLPAPEVHIGERRVPVEVVAGEGDIRVVGD